MVVVVYAGSAAGEDGIGMGEGKRGKPHSELERLEIFAQLAADYFRMVELFRPADGPVPAGSPE
ncbi:MAG TPA: hypothetical protein VK883_12050, partial [Arthrobacter sp.]|nr:hypothetical protein [Arthrobacter sp.]